MKNQISIIWDIEDVKNFAYDLDYELTDDQAMQVLETALDNHDCNVGINWDVLESIIQDLFGG